MPLFIVLCLVSRLAYSLNDILIGRLSREYGRMEVAGWRGVSLGVTMSPMLLWVPRDAWGLMGERWLELLVCIALTAAANLLQNQSARNLPFGLRAAIIVAGVTVGSTLLGWVVLGDELAGGELVFAMMVVGSAVTAALGSHADHEIKPQIGKGTIFAGGASLLMATNAVIVADLARNTHPLLTAWTWEFGAGMILVVPLLLRLGKQPLAEHGRRFVRIALAASPTAIASGLSAIALTMGAIGIWAAVSGTQVLITAGFGAIWHKEKVGPLRWACFLAAAVAVSCLALSGRAE